MRRTLTIAAGSILLAAVAWLGYSYLSTYITSRAQTKLQQQMLGGFDSAPGTGTPIPPGVLVIALGIVVVIAGVAAYLLLRRSR